MKLFNLVITLTAPVFLWAQYPVTQAVFQESTPACGAHELMDRIDQSQPGFMLQSNQMLQDINRILAHQTHKTSSNVSTIPVVFHVLHNTPDENLPDSVIFNQLEILNRAFRRKNLDTNLTRKKFKSLAGDARIEFKLAQFDPQGNPASGIVRKQTNITHFGGTLPYGPGQTALINQWVNDSLYYNLFRLTNDTLGGSNPWDNRYYLNIWIGDLRLFEPQFNNFEELVFLALATPPANHPNWPVLPFLTPNNQGVLMHYVCTGSNNPNDFPAPYTVFNSAAKGGKILIHEVGHYFGLRHIWGDGACNVDDFVKDTPRATASAGFTCDTTTTNSCIDTINGRDLPDMTENYMDYSASSCQNMFTKGQIDIMQNVIANYRQNLLLNVTDYAKESSVRIFPNPSKGRFQISSDHEIIQIELFDLTGKEVLIAKEGNANSSEVIFNGNPGVYLLKVTTEKGTEIRRILMD